MGEMCTARSHKVKTVLLAWPDFVHLAVEVLGLTQWRHKISCDKQSLSGLRRKVCKGHNWYSDDAMLWRCCCQESGKTSPTHFGHIISAASEKNKQEQR